MKKLDFDKIIKKEKPKDIIYLHVHNKITLTNKQLNDTIKLMKEGKK